MGPGPLERAAGTSAAALPAGHPAVGPRGIEEAGLWKGDRLAVLPRFRRHGVGAPLVDFAVRVAGELGGREMLAQIQLANVAFFERLGWRRLGEVADYCGRPHQQMVIALSAAAGRSPARG